MVALLVVDHCVIVTVLVPTLGVAVLFNLFLLLLKNCPIIPTIASFLRITPASTHKLNLC